MIYVDTFVGYGGSILEMKINAKVDIKYRLGY